MKNPLVWVIIAAIVAYVGYNMYMSSAQPAPADTMMEEVVEEDAMMEEEVMEEDAMMEEVVEEDAMMEE
ncbi:hypothetical protein ACFL1A_02830 [Patescibacteria group bacterium]